jgi:CheY-like chemotaxis protein
MLAYSGKGKFVVEFIDLSSVVKEMTHLLGFSISKKAVLQLDLKHNLPAIEADASQLRQVIMNLIVNASEAMEDKRGAIALRTGVVAAEEKHLAEAFLGQDPPTGTYVYLEVSDTGHGMDRETLRRMFEPFFTTKSMGRGLGLAAVLGIVRGHGGAVKVDSEPGQGATFRLFFPSAGDIVPVVSEKPENVEPEQVGGTILVVDDEQTVLDVARQMLERSGFLVWTARNGLEALELLRGRLKEISAVLLDLSMPHMDGVETFKEIRRLRSDLPVILSSGYHEQDATSDFPAKGLAGFIHKPYEARVLVEKLRQSLKEGRK